jgi:hypothetical protein
MTGQGRRAEGQGLEDRRCVMPWRRTLSDEELVNRIRLQTPARRKAGAILLGFSVISFGLFLYYLQKVLTGEWRIDGPPAEQVAFLLGVWSGVVITMALFGAAWWFVLGFSMYLPDRKDKLLLKYHQRLTELGQLPIRLLGRCG